MIGVKAGTMVERNVYATEAARYGQPIHANVDIVITNSRGKAVERVALGSSQLRELAQSFINLADKIEERAS